MTVFKTTFLALASTSLLALAPLASANYVGSGKTIQASTSTGTGYTFGEIAGGITGGPVRSTYLDGSTTATYFYRKGVRNFERGNIEKAEKAFEAVLRTNGLDRQAYLYLAKINAQKGDLNKTQKYTEAYHSYGSK